MSKQYGGARNALVLNGRFVMEQLQVRVRDGGRDGGDTADAMCGRGLPSALSRPLACRCITLKAASGGRGAGDAAAIICTDYCVYSSTTASG